MAGPTGSSGFEVRGTREAQAALKKLAVTLPAAAHRAIATVALEAEGVAKKAAPVDTGALRSSIRQRSIGQLRIEVFTDKVYAAAVENGRSAGAPMPPVDALTGWLNRHGIDPTLGFAVARSIGSKGFAARPFMRPAAEFARVRLPVVVESEVKRAAAEADIG